jgi:hypothetical protein
MSERARGRACEAQNQHWKSQRAVSSIFTLFGKGGADVRVSGASLAMASIRAVIGLVPDCGSVLPCGAPLMFGE